jgi:chaperonin GroEL
MDTKLKKIIKKGDEAKESLLRGIDAVADVVEPTLGPGGQNVVVEQTFYKAIITNDGIRVAKQALNDESLSETDRIGAQLMVDTVSEEDRDAGDGTTTTTCLTRHLAHKVLALNKQGELPMKLKRKIEEEKEFIVAKIKERATMDFSLLDVASVSMENEEHAKIVADIFEKHGKDVDVKITFNKKADKVETEETEGYTTLGGYASSYLAKDKSKMESVSKEAIVYIFQETIDDVDMFIEVLSTIDKKWEDQPIVIFADGFSDEIMKGALALIQKFGKDIQLAKRSQYKRVETGEEIAVVTGARPTYLENFKIEDGSSPVDTITLRATDIVIENPRRQQYIDDFVDEVKDNQERINRLKQSIVTIKVGSKTYSDTNYLRHKYEDAVNAVKGALEEGVVLGGGLTLASIDTYDLEEDFILKGILSKPFDIIVSNMGLSSKEEIEDFEESVNVNRVIDSAKTVRSAVEHACTLAGLLVTTSTVIATKRNQNEGDDESALDTSELPIG